MRWHPMARSTCDPNAALHLCQLLAISSSLLIDKIEETPAASKRVRTGLCMKRGRLRKRQFRTPLVNFVPRQLENLTEFFIAEIAVRRLRFYQDGGVVQDPLKGAFTL
uniref:Uncharacterized protein n=1 Tax=Rhipicephalus zambeziensis TaxID=60191 RepID=A0A224Y4X5_9ACAR